MLLPFAATASMIPGGIEVREGSFIGLMVIYQIKYEIALSVAVLVRLVSTGFYSVIGVICLQIILLCFLTPTNH